MLSEILDASIFSKIFHSLSRRQFDDLIALERKTDATRILPCLCRMTLYPPSISDDDGGGGGGLDEEERTKLRAFLLDFARANTVVTLMGVDFTILESDLRKDANLRKKTLELNGTSNLDAQFAASASAGAGNRFEIGDAATKYRLLLSELLTLQLFLDESKTMAQNLAGASRSTRPGCVGGGGPAWTKMLRRFEPLDNAAYVGDCCDLLVIFLAERPGLISVEDVCELLAFYRNGPDVIRAIVMNFPDTWKKVCSRLIEESDASIDDHSAVNKKRIEALKALCELDKLAAVDLVNYCVDKRKFRLAVLLAVQFLPPDVVTPLVNSVLATADEQQRNALVAFVQSAQRDHEILRDINLPRSSRRSIVPRAERQRTPASTHDRTNFTEMDEAIFDIIGQDSALVTNLRGIRELWEQDDAQDHVATEVELQENAVSPNDLSQAIREAAQNPSTAIVVLRRILRDQRNAHIVYTDSLTTSLPFLLDPAVPLHVLQLVCRLWSKVEALSPRKLYVSTVASLLPLPTSRFPSLLHQPRTTHLEMCKDPLIILRCDERVFRCAPILTLLLRILRCYLATSRAYLQRELTNSVSGSRRSSAAASSTNPVQQMDAEREELMRSLVGAQESAAVQILLEVCLPLASEAAEMSNLTSLREVRCIVCSFIHQLFIADPILSKLVHFQTYPSELIHVTVAGIPSMHICLDFIPEMLSQPVQIKRAFAIELLSCLCEHYAIPKAFGIARLAVNVLSTLVSATTSEEIIFTFSNVLPALARIARVFPPLSPDIVSMLIQVSRICRSRLAANDSTFSAFNGEEAWPNLASASESRDATLLSDINNLFRTQFHDSVFDFP